MKNILSFITQKLPSKSAIISESGNKTFNTLIFILFFFKSVSAQTPYQLFFHDSTVLFHGVVNDYFNSLSQYQKSTYKAAYFDSVVTNSNLTFYYPFKTPNDTSSSANAGDCIDLSGNSWLGNYFFHDTLFHYRFKNKNQENITLHTHEQVGHSWRFYTYPDSSYLTAVISNISLENIGSTSDSVKTIQFHFFYTSGVQGINDWSSKELLISRQYGILKSPHFNGFPNDTSLWIRQHHLNIATTNEIYDFNVGDKFYFEHGKLNIPPDNLYTNDYTLLEVLSKNVDNLNQTTTYVFKSWYYDYKVIFPNPIYLDSIFETTLNFSFLMNESFGIPEKLNFDSLYGVLFDLMEEAPINNLLNITEPVYIKNTRIYLPHSQGCYSTEITVLPVKTVYAKSLGEIYKEVHIYEGAGPSPFQSYFKLLGYEKNGITFGNFLGSGELNINSNNLFSFKRNDREQFILDWQSTESGSISIFNSLGKLILRENVVKGSYQIPLTGFAPGIYFISGITSTKSEIQKIIQP